MQFDQIDTRVIEINGRKIEFATLGEGVPPIILINGAGGPVLGWGRIWKSLAKSSLIFAYNRPGIGKSSKPSAAQTCEAVAEDLLALLSRTGVQPPYVLVCHSMGGLHANYLARKYSEKVAGVVFLDATTPQDVIFRAGNSGPVARTLETLLDAILGKDAFGETNHALESARIAIAAGQFPNVPVIVVTGGKPAMRWLMPAGFAKQRGLGQKALSQLSQHGRQIIASKSGHFPQLTEPELVVEAILEIVSSVKSATCLPDFKDNSTD